MYQNRTIINLLNRAVLGAPDIRLKKKSPLLATAAAVKWTLSGLFSVNLSSFHNVKTNTYSVFKWTDQTRLLCVYLRYFNNAKTKIAQMFVWCA